MGCSLWKQWLRLGMLYLSNEDFALQDMAAKRAELLRSRYYRLFRDTPSTRSRGPDRPARYFHQKTVINCYLDFFRVRVRKKLDASMLRCCARV